MSDSVWQCPATTAQAAHEPRTGRVSLSSLQDQNSQAVFRDSGEGAGHHVVNSRRFRRKGLVRVAVVVHSRTSLCYFCIIVVLGFFAVITIRLLFVTPSCSCCCCCCGFCCCYCCYRFQMRRDGQESSPAWLVPRIHWSQELSLIYSSRKLFYKRFFKHVIRITQGLRGTEKKGLRRNLWKIKIRENLSRLKFPKRFCFILSVYI